MSAVSVHVAAVKGVTDAGTLLLGPSALTGHGQGYFSLNADRGYGPMGWPTSPMGLPFECGERPGEIVRAVWDRDRAIGYSGECSCGWSAPYAVGRGVLPAVVEHARKRVL